MGYLYYDLLMVIQRATQPLSEGNTKYLMYHLLHSVNFIHANGVLHRDLKTSNLLLNRVGEFKVCDFGLSRSCIDGIGLQQPYTDWVVTLWYRAPELLLMADRYSSAIDMWSVGCIVAELLRKAPLFPGRNELDQLHQIFAILGVPDEATWPGFASLCAQDACGVRLRHWWRALRQEARGEAASRVPLQSRVRSSRAAAGVRPEQEVDGLGGPEPSMVPGTPRSHLAAFALGLGARLFLV
ncbi:hypothetical protein Taro_040825 [Colocasia esculenta]|uniref:[RNA-polymerase]-subunit kinase n=1 Tax=Colocasia esculenta TaxID=4460 RepID=A0A843WZ82_COLES|nr:hypothetical protein [Colocasia esculenta]